jgi:hypothetical protein
MTDRQTERLYAPLPTPVLGSKNLPTRTAALDTEAISLQDRTRDPLTETDDGRGILPGHTQGDAEESMGGISRDIKKHSKVTLGRHVTGDPGFAVRDRRKKYNKAVRTENQKVFNKDAAGSKKRR